jgi:hypothetical protein
MLGLAGHLHFLTVGRWVLSSWWSRLPVGRLGEGGCRQQTGAANKQFRSCFHIQFLSYFSTPQLVDDLAHQGSPGSVQILFSILIFLLEAGFETG